MNNPIQCGDALYRNLIEASPLVVLGQHSKILAAETVPSLSRHRSPCYWNMLLRTSQSTIIIATPSIIIMLSTHN